VREAASHARFWKVLVLLPPLAPSPSCSLSPPGEGWGEGELRETSLWQQTSFSTCPHLTLSRSLLEGERTMRELAKTNVLLWPPSIPPVSHSHRFWYFAT
jgi:hypothetical protein